MPWFCKQDSVTLYNFEMEHGREYVENNFVIAQRSIMWIQRYQEGLKACRPQNSDCEVGVGFLGLGPWLTQLTRRHLSQSPGSGNWCS